MKKSVTITNELNLYTESRPPSIQPPSIQLPYKTTGVIDFNERPLSRTDQNSPYFFSVNPSALTTPQSTNSPMPSSNNSRKRKVDSNNDLQNVEFQP